MASSHTRKHFHRSPILRDNHQKSLQLCVFWDKVRSYHISVRHFLNLTLFCSVSQLFATADFMYIIPAYRLTVYIMGVLLGYFMRIYKDLKLTKAQLRIGWWTSTIILLASFIGPAPMGSINYEYNSMHAAIYAAWSPIGWCCFFAWVIFTSHLGYNESKYLVPVKWCSL